MQHSNTPAAAAAVLGALQVAAGTQQQQQQQQAIRHQRVLQQALKPNIFRLQWPMLQSCWLLLLLKMQPAVGRSCQLRSLQMQLRLAACCPG
jgi:hypothetical protein